jgi:DNA polymerase-3 subunit beta
MKITCTQENLARSLSFLERASGKHTSLPILSNFLLQTEKGQLKLSATNLEIGLKCSIGAKIEGEGELTIPVKLLNTFIHNLPTGGVVVIDVTGKTLKVSSGGHSMQIRGMDAKDFPIIPEKKGDYFLMLNGGKLKKALEWVLPSVSVNESRMELTGVNMLFFEKEIHIAATDSFRLAENILSIEGDAKYREYILGTPSIILPAQTLQEVYRIIAPETESVKILFEENQAFFEVDGIQVISRIINGKYPDYKQILPKTFSFEVRMNREEALRAVRMASIFSPASNGEVAVALSPEKGKVIVSSQSSEIGENVTVLDASISGQGELTLSFNPRYVLDGLNAVESRDIAFLANTATTPAAFRAIGADENIEEDFLYIMMPVRK